MLTFLADAEKLLELPQLVFVVSGAVAVMVILGGTVARIADRRARERTRREMAAYVAEGTLDPDKAIAMLEAGEKPGSGGRCG